MTMNETDKSCPVTGDVRVNGGRVEVYDGEYWLDINFPFRPDELRSVIDWAKQNMQKIQTEANGQNEK